MTTRDHSSRVRYSCHGKTLYWRSLFLDSSRSSTTRIRSSSPTFLSSSSLSSSQPAVEAHISRAFAGCTASTTDPLSSPVFEGIVPGPMRNAAKEASLERARQTSRRRLDPGAHAPIAKSGSYVVAFEGVSISHIHHNPARPPWGRGRSTLAPPVYYFVIADTMKKSAVPCHSAATEVIRDSVTTRVTIIPLARSLPLPSDPLSGRRLPPRWSAGAFHGCRPSP